MKPSVLIVAVLCLTTAALAQEKDPPGFDLPNGVVAGSLIRADTSEPIGRQWIQLKTARWSRSTSTDTFGRFKFEHIPAGSYQLSFHHNGYRVRTHGPVDVGEDQSVNVDWKAFPVEPQVAPYTYTDTYLPGQNITVQVRSIRVNDVNVEVFRVPTAEVMRRKSELLDRKTLRIDPSWKPILTYRQPVSGGHQLQWKTTKIRPAFDKEGFYIVNVSGAGTSKLIPIFVTRLSIISKRAPDATWLWATNLDSGEPFKGVQLEGEPTAKMDRLPASLTSLRSSQQNGLAKFEGHHISNVRYWGAVGDSIAYVDTVPASAAQALKFRTYIYSDRPAYRPLDTVNYKVVTRANDQGVYRVRPGESWTITVRDPEGQTIHTATHETNLFGTMHGDLILGESPALGTWTVEARSGKRRQAGQFKVLEYRKPDYKLSVATTKTQYVQGNTIEASVQANYYFGAPLTDALVQWTAYETPFRPWWYGSYYGSYDRESSVGYGRVARSGTARLDEKGRAQISIDVDKSSEDRWLTIEAVVSDATNRQVSARHKVMVTRGTFRLGIRPNGQIFKVGETAKFDVDATTFDGTPSKRDVTVTASLETFSEKHKIWLYQTLQSKKLTTDDKGKVTYPFKIKRDGFIRMEVKAHDQYGNPIVESSFIWATRDASIAGGYKKRSLDILPDQKTYKPGDTARVLVNTSRNDPWVLFSLEGDGIFEPQVAKVKGNSRLFEVKLAERHAPNAYLSVAFSAGKSFYSLSKSIGVSPAHKLLELDIKADKAVYEPGQSAKYTVTVTDRKGQPIETELSVGLVDEAVYAISKELAPPIGKFFYGNRPNPVRTAYSFPSRYLGGADKDGDDDEGGDGVRRDFKDTAYWQAVLNTGKDGKATFEVKLPDNLTTWRLTARAVSKDTLVGARTHQIRTSKDLIATLALPRFFRQGDMVEVVGMIHNRGETLEGVKVTLETSDGITLDSAAAVDLGTIPAASSRSVRWPVEVGAISSATLRIKASGGKFKDAEERTAPVYPVAVDRLVGVSGMASVSTSQTFNIPEGTLANTERLQIRLMPTVAGAVMESLEDLARFPYGCLEQTMNSFLPDLVADKALKTLGVPRSGNLRELPAMVRTGLRKIYEMQQSDGGWGWWYDASHPYMTAFAVYGLGRAKALGWEVRESALTSGVRSAVKQYDLSGDWNTRAFIAYAVAHVPGHKQEKFLDKALSSLGAETKKLNDYSLATLTLAYVAVGNKDAAHTVAQELVKRAEVQGDLAWFKGREGYYSWTDNDKEATAYALRAMLATGVGGDIIDRSIRWLMRRRRGGMWDTTKDTAAAVEALVDVMAKTKELSSRYTARLLINGKVAGKLDVTPENVMSTTLSLDVSPQLLKHGANELAVSIQGTGTLYWSGSLRFGAPPIARQAGVKVEREYWRVLRDGKKTTFKALDPAGVTVGDEVEVRVTLQNTRDYEYLAVEDPLPAGFEVLPGEPGSGFARREVRDEKVAFFATRTGKGAMTLTYRMRAEMAGTVMAAPTSAWLMYLPEVGGNSSKTGVTTVGGSK